MSPTTETASESPAAVPAASPPALQNGVVLGCIFTTVIFTGAFLLFQVQPVISKTILPWFGGSPAVWTTCLLFFQAALCGGYAYAHWVDAWLRPKWRTALHLTIILGALASLPITPSVGWKPNGSDFPVGQILLILAACVGLPYFVVSSTGPLVQSWYCRLFPGRSPYRLYALSNVGSLLALLSYPFVVEPALSVSTQGMWWSVGFGLFAFLYGVLALISCRADLVTGKLPIAHDATFQSAAAPPWRHVVIWFALPALASLQLAATTNHICQDVAVIPFLWIVPLSLYLLSFIITFDHPRWYLRGPFAVAAFVMIFAAVGMENAPFWNSARWAAEVFAFLRGTQLQGWDPSFEYPVQLAVHFSCLFAICMLCHGEVVRLRPAPKYLTSFYLTLSLGGAGGGVFVSLIAPQIFQSYFEWKIGMVAAMLVAAVVLFASLPLKRKNKNESPSVRNLAIGCGLFVALLMLCDVLYLLRPRPMGRETILDRARNFYGVVTVAKRDQGNPNSHAMVLYHGWIVHGMQLIHPSRVNSPTTYYSENSGLGRTLDYFKNRPRLRVGAIGLGIGTLASYAKRDDDLTFYEINPEVTRIAETHFQFLANARQRGAKVEVLPGDARLTMERQLAQNAAKFDVLVLDAFSSDAIPNHLLTKEAFDIYNEMLVPGGAIAVHVSNRHLDLGKVVDGLAEHFGFEAMRVESPGDAFRAIARADWIILTRNPLLAAELRPQGRRPPERSQGKLPLWTDNHNNLFDILKTTSD